MSARFRTRSRGIAPAILAALALAAAIPGAARAQEFALPASNALESEGAPLESALPARDAGPVLAVGTIDWYGVPGLVTRSLAGRAGHDAWRAACGLSQTGDPALGWTALGLGLGAVGERWGAGARVIGRRDRTRAFAAHVDPGEGGVEAGAGAWLELGATARLWASAPSLVVTGAAPPLARPLEAAVAWRAPGLELWLAHRSAPAGYGSASFALGAAVARGGAQVWLETHDAPLAGSLGISLRRARLACSAAVESHPWLPPVTRLALALGGTPAP